MCIAILVPSSACSAQSTRCQLNVCYSFLFFFFALFLLTLSLSLSDCRLMLSQLANGISYANRVPRAKPNRSIDSQKVSPSDRLTDWQICQLVLCIRLDRGWARAFQGGRFGQSPSTSVSTSDDNNRHGLRNLWTLSSYSIYTVRYTIYNHHMGK